jgi:two-component system response regulator QseB
MASFVIEVSFRSSDVPAKRSAYGVTNRNVCRSSGKLLRRGNWCPGRHTMWTRLDYGGQRLGRHFTRLARRRDTRTMGGAADAEILLIEDDRQLATMLTTLLAEEGYRVQVAGDGQTGLHLGLTRRYRALIVDRGLPVRDGLEVLRILRCNGVVTPALVLTARGALVDRVEGLDAGAEDYLVKPFEVAELLARIRALLRRNAAAAQSLSVAGWRLDVARRTAVDPTGEHEEVELSQRECALLRLLATSPEQVFTRAQLLSRVFDHADTENTVDTYVHYLRHKLGREVIHTVYNLGYRLGRP